MKRLFCILLALVMLGVLPAWAEEAEEWTSYESPYGFSLWYDAQAYLLEDDREDGAVVLYPLALYTPLEARNESEQIAVLKEGKMPAGLRIEQPSLPVDEDWTPPADRDFLDMELDIAWPYFCTEMNIENGEPGPCTVEDLFVLVPNFFFSAGIVYPQGAPDGWREKLWDVLATLEFPPQPVITEDFLLDFFQGGAAGMRFIDVVHDGDAEPITLVPYRDMRDFVLEYVEWDDETFTVSEAFPLYTADPLSPGDNLNIYCYFTDVLPNLRFRYTDTEGNAHCHYIFQSGRDGALLLLKEDEI